MMEAIILAGGLGTRLREIVIDMPKPMVDIGGHPFLEILLRTLADKGFGRIVLSVGYLAEKISNHFGNDFAGLELVYSAETTPLGTGGALRLAQNHCLEDHTFIFNGDTYLDLEVSAIEKQWQINRKPVLVARQVADSSRYGQIKINNGQLASFVEKGSLGQGLVNAGCYVLNRFQLDSFPLGTAFSFERDYLSQITTSSTIEVFISDGYFIDIGIPEDYARAQIELKQFIHN
jgi:D-glycero-alpha-D-manno-heptose 1-phosphate guanylyltransferase